VCGQAGRIAVDANYLVRTHSVIVSVVGWLCDGCGAVVQLLREVIPDVQAMCTAHLPQADLRVWLLRTSMHLYVCRDVPYDPQLCVGELWVVSHRCSRASIIRCIRGHSIERVSDRPLKNGSRY